MTWFRKRRQSDAAEVSRDLRQRALDVSAGDLNLEPDGARVWGVLMETTSGRSVATLVCFADGSVSLYFSTGGGTIGAGTHISVKAAADNLLRLADEHLDKFFPARHYPLPNAGRVRFYVHTFDGILTAERDEEALGHGRDALAPVFYGGHAVITEIRETQSSR